MNNEKIKKELERLNKSSKPNPKAKKQTEPVNKQEVKENKKAKPLYEIGTLESYEALRHTPPPKRLFGNFILEGQVTFLFAAPNAGKSILAVQIANAISKGTKVEIFENDFKEGQKVIYFDFENSKLDFFERYVSDTDREKFHKFDKNFLRAQANYPQLDSAKDISKAMIKGLKEIMLQTDAKILIIDNISKLAGNTSNTDVVLDFMCFIDHLKKEYGFTILILGHPRKGNFMEYGISLDDICGSSSIANFIDAAFCINRSSENEKIRYVKQLKVRSKFQYGFKDVFVFNIEKENDCFLKFKFLEISTERQQLKALDDSERESMETLIYELYAHGYGDSLNSIAKQISEQFKIKMYHTQVKRIIDTIKRKEETLSPDIIPF